MGIKMSEAFFERSKSIVKAKDATEGMRGFLRCRNINCRTEVTWVERHNKHYNTQTRFFRLMPKRQHTDSCGFNTLVQIKNIASNSEQNVLNNLENGRFLFRLSLIYEALKEINDNQQILPAPSYDENGKSSTYQSSGNKHANLSTMKKIMELRAKVDEDEELRSTITLDFDRTQIKWSQFYYQPSEYDKCYRYVAKNGQNRKFGVYSHHPICIEGKVKSIVDKVQEYSTYYINLRIPNLDPDENGITHFTSVSLATKDKQIIDSIENYKIANGDYPEIAVYSIVQVRQPEQKERTVYYNIRGQLHYKNQIIIIE